MEKKVFFENSKNSKLVGLLNESGVQKEILILAHGFASDKNTKNFVFLAEMLSKKNISSFRFDFYGHAESGGLLEDITITEAVDDILQAINYVRNLGYQKIGLLGSSFGGIASIMAASKTKDLLFLALKSPVSDYWALEKSRYSKKELTECKKIGFRNYLDGDKTMKLNYSFIADFKNNPAYQAAKRINIPTIIIHGDKDREVPCSQSEKLVSFLSHAKLMVVKGADHRYSDERHAQKMRQAFFEFTLEQFNN